MLLIILLFLLSSVLPLNVSCAETTWSIQVVDSVGTVGYSSSLALDLNGRVHISYLDDTNDDLKYAWWNGSGWVIQVVDSPGMVGRFPSLALDSSGRAHISYLDYTNGDLKYASGQVAPLNSTLSATPVPKLSVSSTPTLSSTATSEPSAMPTSTPSIVQSLSIDVYIIAAALTVVFVAVTVTAVFLRKKPK